MAEMGSYCKAYLASQFRQYPKWTEDVSDLRSESREVDGKEVSEPRQAIADDDILYLQENFVVTDDIFKDEHVVFAEVSDDWKTFCTETLGFAVSDLALPAAAEGASADA